MKKVLITLILVTFALFSLVSCSGVEVDEPVEEKLLSFLNAVNDNDLDAARDTLGDECEYKYKLYDHLMEIQNEEDINFSKKMSDLTVTDYEKKTCVGYTEYDIDGYFDLDGARVEFEIDMKGDSEGTFITDFSFDVEYFD